MSPVDEEFLRKGAARQKMFTALFILLMMNAVILVALWFSGLFDSNANLARIIIFSDLAALAIVYFIWNARINKGKG